MCFWRMSVRSGFGLAWINLVKSEVLAGVAYNTRSMVEWSIDLFNVFEKRI